MSATERPQISHLRQRWTTEDLPDHAGEEPPADSDHGRDAEPETESEDNTQLTEVLVPTPTRPEDPRRPSLEDFERRASQSKRRASRGEELAELAVPPPVRGHRSPSADRRSLEARQKERSASGTRSHRHRRRSTRSFLATELYTVSWLVFFSLLGTLARLGVEAITLYPNSPFPSRVLWANLGGSFTMGFLLEDRRLFREEWGHPDPKETASQHGKVKKTIPLYVGLTTGFCGSFTSFSSFIRDAFLALSNTLPSPSPTTPYQNSSEPIASRNGGFSFLALVAILIVHPAVSLAALQTGAQLAFLLQPVTPVLPFRFMRRCLDPLVVFVGFGAWLGAVFLAIFPPGNPIHWRFRAVLPLVFAPPGCLLRFYASKYMNALLPAFPLGTFSVNIFGTAVLGMAWDLQHARGIGATSLNACAVLEGIMEGFCGCLTTVSTWVAELQGLRRRHGWMYGLTSVAVALGLMVIIMGSMAWVVGFEQPACS